MRQNDYDKAFSHYYQSTKLDTDYLLPLFGLGQLHIHKVPRVPSGGRATYARAI